MDNEELKYDILQELFNISVGKAANMLSEIIHKKIVLNVPSLKILDINNKNSKLFSYLPPQLFGTLMVSSISFEKNLTGKANLIFPATKMKPFINLCLNSNENFYELEFTDVDFDIIKEIGNIILNCIIGEIGNYLDLDLTYTLPKVEIYDKINLHKDIHKESYMHVLILSITFIIDETEIEGAIIIDLALNSLNNLMKKISMLEDGLYE